ncbi:MAG TPA: ketosynthase [Xanthomonadaceae bacterium]|nr:ketosynthase [Xanthomonadaceae bacterium]
MRALSTLLALAYPLLAHAAAYWQSAPLALLAGADLVLLICLPGLLRARVMVWMVLLAALSGLYTLSRMDLGTLPLFAPPILLNAFLAWLFGHTLAAGRMPLIERIVRAMRADPTVLDPAIVAYARRLTAVWAFLFVLLAVLNLVLALLAVPHGLLASFGVAPVPAVPLALWSLFANVLNYAIVGAFFVGEYAWRRRVFPEQPYRSFGDFLQRMIRLGPAFWRDLVRSERPH